MFLLKKIVKNCLNLDCLVFTFLQFEIEDFFLKVHANEKMNFNYCLQQC